MLKLEPERVERYRGKLDELDELSEEISDWHTGTRELLEDKPMRKAVYKSFQEAGEVVVDICAVYRWKSSRRRWKGG